MTTMLSGPPRPPSDPRVSIRAGPNQTTWRGTLPGLTPRLTPDQRFPDFHEEFPAVSREVFDKLFREGGILIILPNPPHTVESAQAKVKLCMTPDETREFVKGYKAVDGAWFVWGDLFL